MKWVILEDKLSKEDDKIRSRVGFGNFPKERAKELSYRFRLLDDDGNVYYLGRCNALEFDALDWAMADSGCTEFQYWSIAQKWVTL